MHVNESVAAELGEIVVNEVMTVLESLVAKDELADAFEFEDEEFQAGMARFIEFCKKDKTAALAGMSMATLMTSDVFFEVLEHGEDFIADTEEDAEEN